MSAADERATQARRRMKARVSQLEEDVERIFSQLGLKRVAPGEEQP